MTAVATARADLEVVVVDGQRATAAVMLCKCTVDEVLLVGAVHTRTDMSPLVHWDDGIAPPAPAARSEGSLQRTDAVLQTVLVGAFSATSGNSNNRSAMTHTKAEKRWQHRERSNGLVHDDSAICYGRPISRHNPCKHQNVVHIQRRAATVMNTNGVVS